jgi:hypothetical protein
MLFFPSKLTPGGFTPIGSKQDPKGTLISWVGSRNQTYFQPKGSNLRSPSKGRSTNLNLSHWCKQSSFLSQQSFNELFEIASSHFPFKMFNSTQEGTALFSAMEKFKQPQRQPQRQNDLGIIFHKFVSLAFCIKRTKANWKLRHKLLTFFSFFLLSSPLYLQDYRFLNFENELLSRVLHS